MNSPDLLPRAYTMLGLIIDDEDQLANKRCQVLLQKGRIIAYVDHAMLSLKPVDENGAENDILFELERIQAFKECGNGSTLSHSEPTDMQSSAFLLFRRTARARVFGWSSPSKSAKLRSSQSTSPCT